MIEKKPYEYIYIYYMNDMIMSLVLSNSADNS